MPIKLLTLCFIRRGDHILLGMKKRGFGQGWWNGFGGKVAENESIEEALHRELKEEVGLVVHHPKEVAVLSFTFEDKPDVVREVHVFVAHQFSGEPQESEEMRPQWFHVAEFPYEEMFPADRAWVPYIVAGKHIEGKFLYRADHALKSFEIKEL